MKETVTDILNRRSVKNYKPDQITDEELMTVLKAGMNAPSGGNKQSPIFIAVQNKEWIKKLCKLNAEIAGAPEGFDVFYGAPTIILVLAEKGVGNPVEICSMRHMHSASDPDGSIVSVRHLRQISEKNC